MTIKLSPSMACADPSSLGSQLTELAEAGADLFHFDVMDGRFVPNFGFSNDIIRALRPLTQVPFEVHMMVEDPERYCGDFVRAGADIVVVHAEATRHLHRTLLEIRQLGAKAGVAINPATPLSSIQHVVPLLDMVVIMTVNPGFAGQPFVPEAVPKVQELRELINSQKLQIDIEVDGHIAANTVPALVEAGANLFVLGTASIFKAGSNPAELLPNFRTIVENIETQNIG
ncbi:ribulose-phosphate 3-epimerase [Bacillus canaveralius]|uniref:Ribulose-phosphate 3-epimerase n=1 Tax=Bacillus canaveralius TaxID=1403243 RepID=A0A2N5GSD8_9BACI|nr:ribulose-phosphate 3-epimerase [Bacillus canaveralius]PLR86550.1 ribulose-phosphate 3-epimerase [Bacillus canaveralius]PLS00321.1 ribulose-phosphate 3-epimerase [Bacillus canaveralius]